MNLDALFPTIIGLEYYVLASAFALSRLIGLMAVMPLFSRMRLTGVVRNGVAFALAIPIIPMIAATLAQMEAATPLLVVLMVKEVLVGATLGFVLGIPFWAAEAAGDIVDLQRGSTMGTLIDPMMTYETSITGTFLGIVMLIIFLSAGGLELMLTLLYDSYGLWPIDQLAPVFGDQAVEALLQLLTRILTMALTLAFPLVMGLFLSDVVLALLARAAPHLNIFALSLIVKTLVFSLILVLYSSFLIHYMRGDLAFLRDASRYLELIR
ncbi:type III secretion system export apparatus subunit SctT [Aquamicrobium sp. LC103]|uniref:type III secretion system export apparatus subunit SctT n=1 Tax=Aquamicrobium sp. LC103 TaxID=1120658 RepID=UPI00063E75AE|nr:type III secretion system export apparatus subunit SctT [Aquamicrobium sp. LC103]TKT69258.1 EscT/YscT/HrcT family type III secretion system export apparatus protein [Aquamicrobium sp. LC103]